MSLIPILYPRNMLADATITADGETTGKPVTRVADRDPTIVWQDDTASTAARTIIADQSASSIPVSAWALLGHNLNGAKLSLSAGATTGALTTQDAVTLATTALFRRTLAAPVTSRYWMLQICASGGAASEIAEWLLTTGWPLPVSPHIEEDRSETIQSNKAKHVSVAGAAWVASLGPSRWRVSWMLPNLSSSQRDDVEAAYALTSGGARFLLLDEPESTGTLRFVEWMNESLEWLPLPAGKGDGDGWDVTLQFEEIL